MRKIFLVLLFSCAVFLANAQTSEDSVKMVVNRLFDAMLKSDGDMLRTCFTDSAILQSIGRDKAGKAIIENETVSAFAGTIAKLPKGVADERIVFDVVKTDGPLAMVWAPYKFYYQSKFSHCGVDSFQLVRINGVWKIQYLIDTRRRNGCD